MTAPYDRMGIQKRTLLFRRYSLTNFYIMEYNSKSSQDTISLLSTPKKETDWYLPENVRDSDAIARNILLNDGFNDSYLVTHLMPEIFGKRTSTSEENSCSIPILPGISESGESKLNQTLEENVSFIDIFGSKTELKQRPSFSTADLDDDFQFFPSDVVKEMLLKDEEDNAKGSMMNVTSCSSWDICTRNIFINASLSDVNGLQKQRCYTAGEYMRNMSEPLGDFSGEVFSKKVNFGCDASTPMTGTRVFPEFSEIDGIQYKHKTPEHIPFHGDISNFNIHSQNECVSPIKTGSPFPMFLYSVTKDTFHFDYKCFIGTTNYKNIKRLEEAEKRRNCANSIKKLPFTLNCSYNSSEMSIGISPQEDATILKIDTTGTTIQIAHGENSVTEKWIVQPQQLTLDINSKGSRISLMNYSDTDLKFKTKFDSKMTNVCPISGILPANGEIGLRILVSRYIKKQFKHDAEDAIIITCGKREKAIQVKICKKNPKDLSLKDRSFICF